MRISLIPAVLLIAYFPGLAQSQASKTVHASIKTTAKHKQAAARSHEGMNTERATQIQSALIKQGYLTGEPTGVWDAASVTAMQKMQGDNGWQTKITPDSRALIKLGLGPGAVSTPAQ